MIFLDNKYRRTYSRIIDRAKTELRSKDVGYFESHHIIPKTLIYTDCVVLLTAREHFICHWLLTKFTTGDDRRKMLYALVSMGNHHRNKRSLTSLEFQKSREAASEIARSRVPSEDELNKRSIALRGKVRTADTLIKMSIAQIGKKLSLEHRKKLSDAHIGSVRSEKHRSSISASNLLAYKTGKRKPIKCQRCGVEGHPGIMHRWHFKKCVQ